MTRVRPSVKLTGTYWDVINMCLAVPFKVVNIEGNKALVEYNGVKLTVDVRLLEDLEPGDYVLVHAGFAIQKMSRESGEEVITIFERLEKDGE